MKECNSSGRNIGSIYLYERLSLIFNKKSFPKFFYTYLETSYIFFLYIKKLNVIAFCEKYNVAMRGGITSKSRQEDAFLSDSFSTIAAMGIIRRCVVVSIAVFSEGKRKLAHFFFVQVELPLAGYASTLPCWLLSSFSRPPFPFFAFRIVKRRRVGGIWPGTLSRLPPLEFPKFACEIISPLNCGMIMTA